MALIWARVEAARVITKQSLLGGICFSTKVSGLRPFVQMFIVFLRRCQGYALFVTKIFWPTSWRIFVKKGA
jgi:hypothetical protein